MNKIRHGKNPINNVMTKQIHMIWMQMPKMEIQNIHVHVTWTALAVSTAPPQTLNTKTKIIPNEILPLSSLFPTELEL